MLGETHSMEKHQRNIIVEDRNESYRLVSDCSRCSGLCCIALYCFKSDGFPQNKPIGKPCINLIYRMFQLRFFLYESKKLASSEILLPEIEQLLQENDAICKLSIEEMLHYPIDSYQDKVNYILKKSCVELKKFLGVKKVTETNFLNRNFRGKNLSGFDFNMKPLIASDFHNCKLKGATFIRTDTRDANFDGADLREAVFLSQGQINAAKGSRRTKLPKHLKYPVTWK